LPVSASKVQIGTRNRLICEAYDDDRERC
jgi:hypothetical protein